MQDNITSVRPQRGNSPQWQAPPPQGAPNYGYYRRPNEQVFEAPVTSVRAVSGAGEQRCWYEQQAVPGSGNPNVGAETIAATLATQRRQVLILYRREVYQLGRLLSHSLSRVGCSADLLARTDVYRALLPTAAARLRARHEDMPYRQFLKLVR